MIGKRPFAAFGHADHGRLDATRHCASNDHDPDRMGRGAVRVWSDDCIAPRQWRCPVTGVLDGDGERVDGRDGAAISRGSQFVVIAVQAARIVLVDAG